MSESFYSIESVTPSDHDSRKVELVIFNGMEKLANFRVTYLPSMKGSGPPKIEFAEIESGRSGFVTLWVNDPDPKETDFDVSVSSQSTAGAKIHLPHRS